MARRPTETLERFWTMLAHNQGCILNASRFAASLSITSPTITKYIDLLVDLLLVRRLVPFSTNIGKRLVKSPKIYVRDSGVVHALLGIANYNELSGHPIIGNSFEGFVIENILSILPERTRISFYRTSAGSEIDLLLEMPNNKGLWAVEVKLSSSAKPTKGFYLAVNDLKPDKAFVVYLGNLSYFLDSQIEVIPLYKIIERIKNP